MKPNPIQKNKKLIAKVYTESEQDKFKRRHLLLLLGILCGLAFSLQSLPSHAAAPGNVTLEVNNGQINIDYSQVDKFNAAQDGKQVKFAAVDGKELILSDKPVKINQAYQPRYLTDLGVRVANSNIVRIPPYDLVRNDIQTLPSIPDMIVMAEAAAVSVYDEIPVVIPGVSTDISEPATAAAPQAVRVASTPASTSAAIPSPTISANDDMMFWRVFGVSALFVSLLLLLLHARKEKQAPTSNLYSGMPDTNAMVGKGKLFDFNGNVMKGRVTPINTTFLNMLWHVGKFTKEGSMNTYFYMAFYIPPQQDYAKSLQKQDAKQTEETHTEV